MVHGTLIVSIGIVKCRFQTWDTTLTIHSNFYHDPNDHDRLLRPQLLFSTHVGSTGTFTIGDKCDTLSLDGKPYPQILYDPKSYLHVALARNANASSSKTEVNMSVLSNENTNLTPSPKLLLLWY